MMKKINMLKEQNDQLRALLLTNGQNQRNNHMNPKEQTSCTTVLEKMQLQMWRLLLLSQKDQSLQKKDHFVMLSIHHLLLNLNNRKFPNRGRKAAVGKYGAMRKAKNNTSLLQKKIKTSLRTVSRQWDQFLSRMFVSAQLHLARTRFQCT